MLELEKFSLAYGKDRKVLEDVNLAIGRGECILFTGESGSGDNAIMMIVQ